MEKIYVKAEDITYSYSLLIYPTICSDHNVTIFSLWKCHYDPHKKQLQEMWQAWRETERERERPLGRKSRCSAQGFQEEATK